MKVKTSELTGAALDWAVAKCEGEDYCGHDGVDGIGNAFEATHYSTDWAQGGPIIEREQFQLAYAIDNSDDPDQPWVCDDYAGQVPSGVYWGTTALIAAMRCYVASKLGDEIEVPEELI